MYKIYLDDNELTDEPDGWVDFTKKISRSVENRWIVISYPNDLIFYGDGFGYIYDLFNDVGYDVLIDFRAVYFDTAGNEVSEILGSIIMTDVEFDMVRKTASVQVKENSYLSRVWNNTRNPVSIPASATKNGEPIIGIDAQRDIDMSNVVSGAMQNGTVRIGWDVFETFKMILANISDNEIGFESTILENLGSSQLQPRKLALISGLQLRKGTSSTAGDSIVRITFSELFRDISRLCNLYMYPDTSASPKVVVGDEFEWFNRSTVLDFDQPNEMTLSFFQDLFYNAVRMGSQTAFSTTDTALNYPRINFASFKNEKYYLSGVNNIDNELDLTQPTIITDTNIINDVLVNGTETYDDRIFMVEYEPFGDGFVRAVKYDLIGETIFNRRLMHDAMMDRYNLSARVTENISAFDKDYRIDYINDGNDAKHTGFCDVFLPQFTFLQASDIVNSCYSTQVMTLSDRVYLDIPQTDGDAQWSTIKWTAPLSGAYQMEFTYAGGLVYPLNNTSEWNLHMSLVAIRKSGSTVVETIPVTDIVMGTGDVELISFNQAQTGSGYILTKTGTFTVNMAINETLEFESRVSSYLRADVNVPAYFTQPQTTPTLNWSTGDMQLKVLASPQVSLDFPAPDISPSEYRGTRINVETALTQQQIKTLYENPNFSLQINNFVKISEQKKAWISNAEINETTGRTVFELITNLDEINEDELIIQRRSNRTQQPSPCEANMLCFETAINSQYIDVI
jgi:hypothetical protein